MPGEIAAAYMSIMPSLRGFGPALANQVGPLVSRQGAKDGAAYGAAMAQGAAAPLRTGLGGAISEATQVAIKNVAIYGTAYLAIQGIQSAIGDMLDSMVGFNAKLEQAQIGFETMLGTASKGEQELQWIKDFARLTPFNYQDVVAYDQQLIALGFDAEQAHTVLRAAGDASAALGRGADGIQRVNLALGQMWTKGKVQSQEMLQLTEAGIGAWQILAEAYGTTVDQVQDRVTRGLISSNDAVPALVAGIEKQFGGLMDRQSTTLTGIWSNIIDTLQQKLAAAGEPLFDEIKVDAQNFLDSLNDPAVLKGLTQIGQLLADAVKFGVQLSGWLWDSRSAILALAAGYAVMRLAMSQAAKLQAAGGVSGVFGGMLGGTAGQWREASLAARAAGVEGAIATTSLAQAQTEYAKAAMLVGKTSASTAAASSSVKASIYNYESWTAATKNLRIAQSEQFAAQQQLTGAIPGRLAAEASMVAATEKSAAAEATLTAARRNALLAAGSRAAGLGAQLGVGVGAGFAVDGVTKLADASADASQQMAGLVETTLGATAAGAGLGFMIGGPLGSAIGAGVGAVGGYVTSMYTMSAAQQAANADVSQMVDLLGKLGVAAPTAQLALAGVTNSSLGLVGGAEGLTAALQSGDIDTYLAKVKAVQVAYQKLADQAKSADTPAGDFLGLNNGLQATQDTNAGLLALLGNETLLKSMSQDITASFYQQAFAADEATGGLGRMTEQAWKAVLASGGLSDSALQATARMEGMAGVAGYATQMLVGIPKDTPINFNTNAADILDQIVALKAASETFGQGAGSMTADAFERRMRELKAAYTAALQDFSTTPTLTLPDVPDDSADKLADEAARKLEQDRRAQLAFADAFAALMQNALDGDYDQFRKQLTDQIQSLARDGYQAAADRLKELSGALDTAAQDYSALTNKMKAATDAQSELTAKMQDQYNTSRDLILGLGKATDAQSFDQLTYLLSETTSAATQYQDVLEQLKAAGLSDDLWNQLAQAGPESMALAQSILAAGGEGIAQLNTLSDGLVDASESMGKVVSDSMYKQGAEALQAYIDGLKSQEDALTAQLVQIGNNVLTQVSGQVTPGNAGFALFSAQPSTTTNTYNVTIDASELDDIQKIQDFINKLNAAPTTQLVNAAGQVVS